MDDMGAHVAVWVLTSTNHLLPVRNKLFQHLVSEDEEVEEVDGD